MRENGAVAAAMQRLPDVTTEILRRGSDIRTDNLASRRTEINNARGLASPSQIVISHTRNTRRLSSLSVARVPPPPVGSWGMLRRNIRMESPSAQCITRCVDQATAATVKKSICYIVENYIRHLTLINSRTTKDFDYLNRIV